MLLARAVALLRVLLEQCHLQITANAQREALDGQRPEQIDAIRDKHHEHEGRTQQQHEGVVIHARDRRSKATQKRMLHGGRGIRQRGKERQDRGNTAQRADAHDGCDRDEQQQMTALLTCEHAPEHTHRHEVRMTRPGIHARDAPRAA
jgi:hypothetical protein